MRNYLTFIKILLLLLLLTGMCFVSGCDDDDCENKNTSISLVDKANHEIKKIDPDAFIAWAGGRRTDGEPLSSPEQDDFWNFIAVSLPADIAMADTGIKAYWWMEYDGKAFTVKEIETSFEIACNDIGVVDMEVSKAWRLASEADYAGTFSAWKLFQPLNPSATDDPIYVFSLMDGSSVSVNTVTGEVFQEWQTIGDGMEGYLGCMTFCGMDLARSVDWCREARPGELMCIDICAEEYTECTENCENNYR